MLFKTSIVFANTPVINGSFSIPSDQFKDGTLIVLTFKEKVKNEFKKVEVQFEGENFPMIDSTQELTKFALIPVPFNSLPRKTKIKISAESNAGKEEKELLFSVIDGQYRHETLKVQNSKINPSKINAKRIMDEQKEVGALYKIETPKRFWSGKFSPPLPSEITSPFGNKRIYNGQMKSFHQGMDFRAKIGTEIKAPEAGEVVLAKDLYLTGWTVILDHGYGLFTVYCHMSKLGVKVGQVVKKSEVLGLSGDTGRVSGPHLHWGAVISRSKINPENLLSVLPEKI